MESTVLVKAFALLEALCAEPVDRPLADLASATGLAKPTAHRVLKTLVALGYVQRSDAGVYRVSDKLRRLTLPQDNRRLLEAASPVLAELHRQTTETVNLGVLRDDRVVYLSVIESHHPLRRVAQQLDSDPFHCTALGRAMAAFLDEPRREALLRRGPFAARTPRTITRPADLRQVLQQVRQSGLAIEENETDIGVMCLGAPIFDAQGVAAAISLSVPSARVDTRQRQALLQALRHAAATVTIQLGGRLPQTGKPPTTKETKR